MRKSSFPLLLLALMPVLAFAEAGKLETFLFYSEILENERTIRVYLPPGYETSERRYPVFYLQDGQNLMDGNTASRKAHVWRVDKTANLLIGEGKIEPIILVGIDHMNDARADEYNVVVETSQGAGPFIGRGGQGELYGYMVTDELIPLINERYRTQTNPERTAVGGASFGCNISLYLALEYPETFGNVMAMSCSTWFGSKWLLKTIRGLHKAKPVRVWLDVGDREYNDEGWNQAEVFRHSELYEAFIARGWKKNEDLFFQIDKDGRHVEDDWARRFPLVLQWLFGKPS